MTIICPVVLNYRRSSFSLKFILRFSHSFGYDCNLRNNLHVLDESTLAFVTGNLIHFFNPESIHLIIPPCFAFVNIIDIHIYIHIN